MACMWDPEQELEYFREYLRIPSVHPDPDYGAKCALDISILYLIDLHIHRTLCGVPAATGRADGAACGRVLSL